MAVNWGQVGSASSDIFGGVGQLVAAGGYSKAAKFAGENAALTARMTDIEIQQSERQAYQLVGGTQADVAAGGFSLSGSAIDILKSNAQQASLSTQLLANQGLIEQNAYLAQEAQYGAMATASTISGIGGIVSGIAGFAAMSDVRSKTDIETVGYDKAGRRWVDFRYLWDEPGTKRRGVIAQEIAANDPQAVSRDQATGLFLVDYSKLRGTELA